MSGEPPRQGPLDTNILILRRWIEPDEMAISAGLRARGSGARHGCAAYVPAIAG